MYYHAKSLTRNKREHENVPCSLDLLITRLYISAYFARLLIVIVQFSIEA